MSIEYILMSIAAFLLIFLLLREFNSWYWKINDIVELLSEQNELLSKLVNYRNNNVEEDDEEEINHSPKKSFFEKLKDEEDLIRVKKK